ncbi:hypothetical protein C0J52_22438 [Blattella germanica]|nr:hypothetical protein C0J52_22438 [Blattella germanica]
MPGPSPRQHEHIEKTSFTPTLIFKEGEYDEHDYDGQMMSEDRLGLKFPDIYLMGEEKPQKNLTQETRPDRESNPGPLRERRIRYPPLHNGGL